MNKEMVIEVYEQLNVKRFLANLDKYDFKDGDYTDICTIFYGPHLEIRIQAGFDFYTVNEDGTVSNNKETDRRHYYVEAMLYVDMHGVISEDCLGTVWYDEVVDEIDENVAGEIWNDVHRYALDYIEEETNKLEKVWIVSFSTDCDADNKTTIFKNYENAKKYFDACVRAEKGDENSVAYAISRASEEEIEDNNWNFSDEENYFEASDDWNHFVVLKLTETEIY